MSVFFMCTCVGTDPQRFQSVTEKLSAGPGDGDDTTPLDACVGDLAAAAETTAVTVGGDAGMGGAAGTTAGNCVGEGGCAGN